MTTTTEFPVADDDSLRLRVKLLRGLSAAAYPKESLPKIAMNHNLTVPDVKALIEGHGWPDQQEMRRAADKLEGKTPQPQVRQLVHNNITTTRPPVSPQPPANGTEQLIGAGEKSSKARTRRLAAKIREQLNELRELVIAERKEREEAAAAEAEKERLRAEVKELEEQLAAKRAALRGGQEARRTAAVTSAEKGPASRNAAIREWAADQGLDCNAHGRIPAAVVEAYDEAHGGAG